MDGTQELIQNNTIQRTALAGITMGSQSKVFNNLVEGNCLVMEDCGNLNSWSLDGQGTEIAYNDGVPIEGLIVGKVKGGLKVDIVGRGRTACEPDTSAPPVTTTVR